ncbi:hypothetical protein BU26DRAFT_308653 [Trematosphaeria pertusa]|uniref:Protein kinase domain-containing protein n=1 Tax=Trematosphaeria pertusa TaxID=390896 RepID=A0A6A6IFC3_9PLEO|nr:uncharacterized protein BU26DRAFT_308653 [Trematosphaeria pertusa]KAF2248889.1 hypothetical protein BU26DRAFT_308653 [Trematosphaeria pertusa]
MTELAGLSIAIFDQLLKLGEKTAQIISDARSFNDDTEQYYNKIVDENNRTKQLRHILFEPSPIYGGLTLFENFDDDVQQQIKVFLGRLVHMLKEALDLLESRYGNNEAAKKPSMTTSLSSLSLTSSRSSQEARSPSPRSWKHYSRQSISLLKWSLQDKKRTEEVLKDFSDLNGRIHENIKLWCLASSIGLNMQHLKRLQNDENAKQLGFDIDATLQITATEVGRMDFSFELSSAWLECLRRATPVEERFALVQEDGKTFLMEHRRYDGQPDVAGEIDSRTRIRINDLAGLLSQPKEKVFCIPRCVGWKYVQSQSDIAFLFETPQGCIPEPVSLYRLLDMKTVKLTLGQRFKLASALAKCITQLQMVKWVHESFRSENILFFPSASKKCIGSDSDEPCIDYGDPCVLGFEFTRPEIDFSAGFADLSLERDVYRHPERQGRPGRMFTKIHDVYALGVVLLEIGLWQRAITLEKNQFRTARDPFVIQAQLLKQAQRRLGDKMGEKYQQVVIACLTGEFGVQNDTREDLKLQQAFRTQVVDVLERASSCL